MAVVPNAAAQSSNGQSLSPNLSAARFIAGLFWSSSTGLHRRCAATVVSNSVLLTSASCALNKYPIAAYGPGSWVVIAGSDSRYLSSPASNSVQTFAVRNIDIDQCGNLGVITLAAPMILGDTIKAIALSSAAVPMAASLNTYSTINPYGSPFLVLTQGNADECELMLPGYAQDNFMCTQPVQGQIVTGDYLGGDPIIGYGAQNGVPVAVLVGITGQFYSTLASAQNGSTNDPTAYRFSALVRSHINQIASMAGVGPSAISNSSPLS